MKIRSYTIFFALAGIYIVTGLYMLFMHVNNSSVTVKPLKLSNEFGQWSGIDIQMERNALELISPDAMVFKLYKNDMEDSIVLYLGFYETMEKSDLAHSPLVCYTGQGWDFKSNGSYSIKLSDPYDNIHISSIIIEKGNQKQLVWYWFQSKYYSSESLWKMRIQLFLDKLLGNNTQNYFIRLSTPIDKTEEIAGEKLLQEFIKLVYPELDAHF